MEVKLPPNKSIFLAALIGFVADCFIADCPRALTACTPTWPTGCYVIKNYVTARGLAQRLVKGRLRQTKRARYALGER